MGNKIMKTINEKKVTKRPTKCYYYECDKYSLDFLDFPISDELFTKPYTNKPFPFVFSFPAIAVSINLTYTQVLAAGEVITFNIHKNKNTTPSLSISLSTGETSKTLTTSLKFRPGETFDCTLVTTEGIPSDEIGDIHWSITINYCDFGKECGCNMHTQLRYGVF